MNYFESVKGKIKRVKQEKQELLNTLKKNSEKFNAVRQKSNKVEEELYNRLDNLLKRKTSGKHDATDYLVTLENRIYFIESFIGLCTKVINAFNSEQAISVIDDVQSYFYLLAGLYKQGSISIDELARTFGATCAYTSKKEKDLANEVVVNVALYFDEFGNFKYQESTDKLEDAYMYLTEDVNDATVEAITNKVISFYNAVAAFSLTSSEMHKSKEIKSEKMVQTTSKKSHEKSKNTDFLIHINANDQLSYLEKDLEKLEDDEKEEVYYLLSKIKETNKDKFQVVGCDIDENTYVSELRGRKTHVMFYAIDNNVFLILGASTLDKGYDYIPRRMLAKRTQELIDFVIASILEENNHSISKNEISLRRTK